MRPRVITDLRRDLTRTSLWCLLSTSISGWWDLRSGSPGNEHLTQDKFFHLQVLSVGPQTNDSLTCHLPPIFFVCRPTNTPDPAGTCSLVYRGPRDAENSEERSPGRARAVQGLLLQWQGWGPGPRCPVSRPSQASCLTSEVATADTPWRGPVLICPPRLAPAAFLACHPLEPQT